MPTPLTVPEMPDVYSTSAIIFLAMGFLIGSIIVEIRSARHRRQKNGRLDSYRQGDKQDSGKQDRKTGGTPDASA